MYRLVCFSLLFTAAYCNEIHFSYFDKVLYEEKNIHLDALKTKLEEKDIETAYIFSYSYPINPSSILSLHGGTSLAKFDRVEASFYAYSTYLSARVSPISVLTLAPFIEFSLAGPTYVSKQVVGDIDFKGNIIYQHYIGAGVKVAAFIFDVKLINFSENLSTAFTKHSITMPYMISVGCSY